MISTMFHKSVGKKVVFFFDSNKKNESEMSQRDRSKKTGKNWHKTDGVKGREI